MQRGFPPPFTRSQPARSRLDRASKFKENASHVIDPCLPPPNTMTEPLSRLICEHCDTLYQAVPLQRGEATTCRRCGAVLERARRLSVQQHFALALTAAILFVFANAFPVMGISLEGLNNAATLYQSVQALNQGRISPLAAVTALTIILAPLMQVTLLCWVLGFACRGKAAPGFRLCMRTLEHLRPWSMLEVCLLGILVAIIKLGGMLNVHPGVGLWALAMLTVLLIALGGRGVRHLWADFDGHLR